MGQMKEKKKKQRQYKSNMRRITLLVTAQTDDHLKEWCAMAGWGEKHKGRVVDRLVQGNCLEGRYRDGRRNG